METSESVDDYLKAILDLGGAEDSLVTTQAVAQRLGVRTPSATGMIQKLALHSPPLVVYAKHRGVHLSAAGKRRAWELLRHHRLLEKFLHDVLKYSWDEVHDEAERLEHFISERFEDRVATILGDPEFDPHGHAIPQKHQSAAFREEVPLELWPLQIPAVITSVSDRNAAALRELERLGLKPGIFLTVEKRNRSGSASIHVANRRGHLRVGSELAGCVLVAAVSNGQLT